MQNDNATDWFIRVQDLEAEAGVSLLRDERVREVTVAVCGQHVELEAPADDAAGGVVVVGEDVLDEGGEHLRLELGGRRVDVECEHVRRLVAAVVGACVCVVPGRVPV